MGTHHPPAREPKKHPPVNVETMAPWDAALGWLKSERKLLKVSTEEMIPLKKSDDHVSAAGQGIRNVVGSTHLSYLPDRKRRN